MSPTAVRECVHCFSMMYRPYLTLRSRTNIAAGTADYPGDGTTKIVWTDTRDISLFVLRALDMEEWPEDLGMRGDVKSYKDIVDIFERVQGRKWLARNNSVEELSAPVDDPGKKFYNQVRRALARGDGMVGNELNREFPDVRPVTCEEFVEKWWSGVKFGEPSWGEDILFGDDNM